MKTKTLMFITGCAALMVGAFLVMGAPQPAPRVTPKEFMRDKLELSQGILAGLTAENFDLIAVKSKRLGAMSREAGWEVFQNPDYARQSENFRRTVDSLTKAAQDKNLDGATLAYVKMTMSCVECHKLVRGKLVAQVN